MTCESCAELCHQVTIRTSGELWAAVNVAKQNVEDGTILQVHRSAATTTPIEELRRDTPIPDLIQMDFHCIRCDEQFHLVCETYHGAGGRWSWHGDDPQSIG